MNLEDERGVNKMNLRFGSPGVTTLKSSSGILLEATKTILHEDCDITDIFSYGSEGGDDDFRQRLAQFLSGEYGDQVKKECVSMTAGATHGIHLILTVLASNSSPVFVIDPTYFFGQMLIKVDMQRTIVPVPSDSDGPIMDVFENLVRAHLPKDGGVSESSQAPFLASVYLIPVFNNPTGMTYSHEKCQQLIGLARKYNLLLLTEDVYNMIYFHDQEISPKRLLAFDLPSDPDYGIGHVVSNGTFSKILAPSVRLGWIESSKEIIQRLSNSNLAHSGGAFNHYVGKLVTEILRSGKQKEHVKWLRSAYKSCMESLCDGLDQYLPKGCSFQRPQGGYFVWVQLRSDTDAEEFLQFCESKLIFLPGIKTSPTSSYKNYARLSFSFMDAPALSTAAKYFCEAYIDFLQKKGLE